MEIELASMIWDLRHQSIQDPRKPTLSLFSLRFLFSLSLGIFFRQRFVCSLMLFFVYVSSFVSFVYILSSSVLLSLTYSFVDCSYRLRFFLSNVAVVFREDFVKEDDPSGTTILWGLGPHSIYVPLYTAQEAFGLFR